MKIIERKEDKLIEIRKIKSIDGLDDSTLILLERGDTIKKAVKNGRTMFGNKNLYSLKSMKEAIVFNTKKQNKKNKSEGHFCCVCGDWFPNNQLDQHSVCSHCQLA